MTGAKVNGRIVPFDHVLQNGDIVEVTTSASSKGPARDWISIAKSSEARSKIKQWFKKEKREENIVHGKASFEAELKRNNISMAALAEGDIMPVALKKLRSRLLKICTPP
jgi:GTP pyrophosphokinase